MILDDDEQRELSYQAVLISVEGKLEALEPAARRYVIEAAEFASRALPPDPTPLCAAAWILTHVVLGLYEGEVISTEDLVDWMMGLAQIIDKEN
jgi:hypothetical protein